MNAQELSERKYEIGLNGELMMTTDGTRYTDAVCPYKSDRVEEVCGAKCPLFVVVHYPERKVSPEPWVGSPMDITIPEKYVARLGCSDLHHDLEI